MGGEIAWVFNEYLANISKYGRTIDWDRNTANLRSQMHFTSYLDRELEYSEYYYKYVKNVLNDEGDAV